MKYVLALLALIIFGASIALAETTSAPVSLTVEKYVSISFPAQTSFDLDVAPPAKTADSATKLFNFESNCSATVTGALTAPTGTSGYTWHYNFNSQATEAPLAVAATGNAGSSANVTVAVSGVDLNIDANTYATAGQLVLTITAN